MTGTIQRAAQSPWRHLTKASSKEQDWVFMMVKLPIVLPCPLPLCAGMGLETHSHHTRLCRGPSICLPCSAALPSLESLASPDQSLLSVPACGLLLPCASLCLDDSVKSISVMKEMQNPFPVAGRYHVGKWLCIPICDGKGSHRVTVCPIHFN